MFCTAHSAAYSLFLSGTETNPCTSEALTARDTWPAALSEGSLQEGPNESSFLRAQRHLHNENFVNYLDMKRAGPQCVKLLYQIIVRLRLSQTANLRDTEEKAAVTLPAPVTARDCVWQDPDFQAAAADVYPPLIRPINNRHMLSFHQTRINSINVTRWPRMVERSVCSRSLEFKTLKTSEMSWMLF